MLTVSEDDDSANTGINRFLNADMEFCCQRERNREVQMEIDIERK